MSDTLLLNSNFEPISILPLSVISWQHAIKLMFLDRVEVIEEYPDWIITVPMMCLEFYLILKVAGAKQSLLWKMIFYSVVML